MPSGIVALVKRLSLSDHDGDTAFYRVSRMQLVSPDCPPVNTRPRSGENLLIDNCEQHRLVAEETSAVR